MPRYAPMIDFGRDRGEGFENETNDCAVNALRAVTGVPYSDSHGWLKIRGRQDRKGTYMTGYMDTVVNNQTTIYGYRVYRLLVGYKATLSTVMPAMKSGKYLVLITHHAIAVVNGVVMDWKQNGMGSRVERVYQFKPASEVEAQEKQAIEQAKDAVGRFPAQFHIDSITPYQWFRVSGYKLTSTGEVRLAVDVMNMGEWGIYAYWTENELRDRMGWPRR